MLRAYFPPRSFREETISQPTEMEVQALWFEQLYRPLLTTDDGRTAEIIQPGFWNHTGGPDFTRAVVRFSPAAASPVAAARRAAVAESPVRDSATDLAIGNI